MVGCPDDDESGRVTVQSEKKGPRYNVRSISVKSPEGESPPHAPFFEPKKKEVATRYGMHRTIMVLCCILAKDRFS